MFLFFGALPLMHVAGFSRETFSGFGHEAGSDAAQGFDDVSE